MMKAEIWTQICVIPKTHLCTTVLLILFVSEALYLVAGSQVNWLIKNDSLKM